jgi:IMP dehydrogenase
MAQVKEFLTFDDVLLQPRRSSVLPNQVNIQTQLTKDITLNIPILSAAMDTVTESRMAIAMAQNGGLGVIHKNFDISTQASEVARVKRFEAGIVYDPITMSPNNTIEDVFAIMDEKNISGFPVVDKNKKLLGIITNRDVRFVTNKKSMVKEYMTKKVITIQKNQSTNHAKKLLHENRIEKLVVVDSQKRCIGLITVKDIQRSERYPSSVRDKNGRLLVGAAVGTKIDDLERAIALDKSGVDILFIDTAHGHSNSVIDAFKKIRKKTHCPIVVGNIATPEAAKDLIKLGVDAIKVGIGPGSICTTRVVAGVGVPQFTAIQEISSVASRSKIPMISDGGIRFSGDIVKALAAGGNCIMAGSLFAGTDESPGEVFLFQGRSYKSYRGMGSLGAMARGSADRYFQDEINESIKLVPEGIEGRIPYKGPVSNVLFQLTGGLKSGMGYTGSKNLSSLRKNAKFIRLTNSGITESHVHGVQVTKEAPNYRSN